MDKYVRVYMGHLEEKMGYKIYSSKYIGVKAEPIKKEFYSLDKNMQEGYGLFFEQKLESSFMLWNKVLDEILSYMEGHNIQDIKSFDKVFNGNQYISNWIQDYDNCLREHIENCHEELDRRQAGEQKIRVLNFILNDSSIEQSGKLNAMRSKAETHYLLGNDIEGEILFKKMIKDFPDYVWGYVGYSDQYWLERESWKGYDDEKALKILTEAYNRETIEEVDVIIERLTDLTIKVKKTELEEYMSSRVSQEIQSEVNVIEVLERIRKTDKQLLYPEMIYVNSKKEEALPFIRKEIQEFVSQPQAYVDNNDFFIVYIPYMLGQWEDKTVSELLIDLVSCSDEELNTHIGDLIADGYPQIIYKCFDSNINYLKEKEYLYMRDPNCFA